MIKKKILLKSNLDLRCVVLTNEKVFLFLLCFKKKKMSDQETVSVAAVSVQPCGVNMVKCNKCGCEWNATLPGGHQCPPSLRQEGQNQDISPPPPPIRAPLVLEEHEECLK
jgi:hypothetical protein